MGSIRQQYRPPHTSKEIRHGRPESDSDHGIEHASDGDDPSGRSPLEFDERGGYPDPLVDGGGSGGEFDGEVARIGRWGYGVLPERAVHGGNAGLSVLGSGGRDIRNTRLEMIGDDEREIGNGGDGGPGKVA